MKTVIIFENDDVAKVSRWPLFLHFTNRKNIFLRHQVDHLINRVPMIFWKKSGQSVVEMTRPEKIEKLNRLSTLKEK